MKSSVAVTVSLLVFASAAFAQNPGESKVIIGFNGTADAGLFTANGGKTDGVVISSANALAGTIRTAAIAGLRNLPGVAYIEEDGPVFIAAKPPPGPTPAVYVDYFYAEKMTDVTTSTDATYPAITSVGAGDPAADERAYGRTIMRVDDVSYTGAGIKLVIIDTGIDSGHGDLTVAGGANFVPYPYNYPGDSGDWLDDNGHGTHCAGIVAARSGNGGVTGVAPGVSLYAVKSLDSGGGAQWSWVAKGIDWARTNGMHIASMSLGGGSNQTVSTACTKANNAGVLLVAAAGNSGNTSSPGVSYPAAYTSVMAIAATDEGDFAAFFSSYTASTTAGADCDCAAPGVRNWSTVASAWADSTSTNPYNQRPDTSTALGRNSCFSGTSMATPHAAAIAALVLESHPGMTNSGAWAKMKDSVDPVYDRAAQTTSQWHLDGGATAPTSVSPSKYGTGRLNAAKAVSP